MKLLAESSLNKNQQERLCEMAVRFIPQVKGALTSQTDGPAVMLFDEKGSFLRQYHWYEFLIAELLRWIEAARQPTKAFSTEKDFGTRFVGATVSSLFSYVHQEKQERPKKHLVDILYDLVKENNHNFLKKFQK